MIPDLSAADEWLAARPVTERKRRGQWVTPWWLAEQAVDRLAPDLPPRPHVADLACGDGRWLVAVGRRFPGARLTGVDADPLKRKLVRVLSDLCRDLRILVVAEGVETTAERDTLVDLGCDLLQGYLFARPGAPFPVPVF